MGRLCPCRVRDLYGVHFFHYLARCVRRALNGYYTTKTNTMTRNKQRIHWWKVSSTPKPSQRVAFLELSGLTDSVTDTGTVTSSEVAPRTNPSTCVMRMNRPTSLCPRLGLSWSDGSSEGSQVVGPVCALVFGKLYSNSVTIYLLPRYYYMDSIMPSRAYLACLFTT